MEVEIFLVVVTVVRGRVDKRGMCHVVNVQGRYTVSKRRTVGRQEAGQAVEVRELGRGFSTIFTRASGAGKGKAGRGVEDTIETAWRATMMRCGFRQPWIERREIRDIVPEQTRH
jgi:hypothetical protein